MAQGFAIVGRIVLTQGQIQARDTRGKTRPLSRRSELYAGDTLVTSPGGYVQARMMDGAVIAVAENSEFLVHAYAYDGNPATPDAANLALHRGAFRTITGLIHPGNGDTYAMTTPHVTVTPTEANYECAVSGDRTWCGVYDGGIRVGNPAGDLVLGLGARFDYMEAGDSQVPPLGLMRQPAALGAATLNPGAQRTPASHQNGTSLNRTMPVSQTPGPGNPTLFNTATGATPPAPNPAFPAPSPVRVKPYKKP